MHQQEEKLRKYIIELLKPHFEVHQDVRGAFTHWNETRTVIMDLGILPKSHLIQQGFPNYFIGIEVKFFDLVKKDWDHTRKMKLALNQCITYKYSKFGNAKIEPALILLADNIFSKYSQYEWELVRNFISSTDDIRNMCFGQNIGSLSYNSSGLNFKFVSPFWSETAGFKRSELLNFHAGNRGSKNPIKPVVVF